MANTFTKIASVTVGSGGTSAIEFTSIPQTYTDLCIKFSGRVNVMYYQRDNITFNSSTSGYSERLLYGADGSKGSATLSGGRIELVLEDGTDYTSNTFSNNEMYIPNYTSSNYKSLSTDYVTENNSSTNWQMGMNAAIWSNTSAITSIKFVNQNGVNYLQYTTFTLYGIKNS